MFLKTSIFRRQEPIFTLKTVFCAPKIFYKKFSIRKVDFFAKKVKLCVHECELCEPERKMLISY